MNRFRLSDAPIDITALGRDLASTSAGACVTFEGRVRDHNHGRAVHGLAYQAYAALAEAEGARIVAAAMQQFPIVEAYCVHRVGVLEIGDVAVWVGVSAAHRDAAFAACRHIVDEVKKSVPIWKNERYANGESGWLHPDDSRVDPAGVG
ncbi:MAG: molybdenum cofactor biosynthesis protein MoaE [Rudaea sp.]|nr:molybdenum cofactor biosynthesis protein MoaE [Rudaea sp.]